MNASNNPALLDWKPVVSAGKRLSGSSTDWSRFKPGDQIGVYLGNHWRRGEFLQLRNDSAIVRAVRAGSRNPVDFAVYDARNLCLARELRSRQKDSGSPLLEGEQ